MSDVSFRSVIMVISDRLALTRRMAAAMQQAQDVTGGVQIQEEEEQFGPLLVSTLEQHGIAATDVKKLTVCR